ncbi:type II secretion system F family protein [Singulisphaera sp. PoT]|uniref:type II secretion system F family protein n=1 Tax=Singulisphaera sp. PoT TaxID=3411797 RepID=UPI003BF5B6AE
MGGKGKLTPGLSGQDATILASQLADATAAGMPLHSGLLALSEEVPSRGLRSTLGRLAKSLEQGTPLDAALAAEGGRIPPYLRTIVDSGLRSGHLGEVLGNFANYTSIGSDLRRSLMIRLIYPVFTMVLAVIIFVFVSVVLITGFARIFADFGVPIPLLTRGIVLVGTTINRVWWPVLQGLLGLGVVGVVLSVVMPKQFRGGLITFLPLFGRVWRLTSLAEFCHLLALLLESEVPLEKALTTAGGGIDDGAIATASRSVAAEVAAGRPLAEALQARAIFPSGFEKILGWAEERQGLPEALHMVGEMIFARAHAESEFLASVCSILAMMAVLLGVSTMIIGLMLPLFSLITKLSG